jgi:WD40 repeat protein
MRLLRGFPLTVVLLVCCSVPIWAETPAPPARVDLQGDPLPEGALTRLGTTRFSDSDFLYGASLSPDGKILALSTRHGISLLDAATGKKLRSFRSDRTGERFLFTPDGKKLVSTEGSGGIEIIDVASGKSVQAALEQPARLSGRVSFSADGKLFAAAHEDVSRRGEKGAAYVWDISGKQVIRVEILHNLAVELAFSPDGKLLATGGLRAGTGAATADCNCTIQLWDVATGKERGKLVWAGRRLSGLAFAPDGKSLVTAAYEHLEVWDLATGKLMRKCAARGDTGGFLQFSPDGRLLVVSGRHAAQVWDAKTGRRLAVFQAPPARSFGVGFAGRKVIAWAVMENSVALWDVLTDRRLSPALRHDTAVSSLCFGEGGRELVSLSTDGRVCRWNVRSGRPIRSFLLNEDSFRRYRRLLAGSLLLSEGKQLVTGDSSDLTFWDVDKKCQLFSLSYASSYPQFGAAISGNGEVLATLSEDAKGRNRRVHLVDPRSGLELPAQITLETEDNSIALSPDGNRLLTWGSSSRPEASAHFAIWNTASGKSLWLKRFGSRPGLAAIFSPDGRIIAGDGFNEITLFDADTGNVCGRLPMPPATMVSRMAFAPDGRTLALGLTNSDRNRHFVVISEIASGTIRKELKGHEGMITALAFSPDGRKLASGSTDTTVLVWDPVGVGDRPVKLKPKEAEKLWATLSATKARDAYPAMRQLMAAPGDAVTLFRRHLKPIQRKPVDPRVIAGWITDLDDKRFGTRRLAMQSLEAAGKDVEAALRKALTTRPSLELRRNVEHLLDLLSAKTPTPEMFRPLRALEVLERIGTPEARKLLKTLAGGTPGAWLTEEARTVLHRLNPGPPK